MGLDNPLHLAFLAMMLLLVFGAKRLPEMGRSLGAGLRGFRESIGGETGSLPQLSEASVSAPSRPSGVVSVAQPAHPELSNCAGSEDSGSASST